MYSNIKVRTKACYCKLSVNSFPYYSKPSPRPYTQPNPSIRFGETVDKRKMGRVTRQANTGSAAAAHTKATTKPTTKRNVSGMATTLATATLTSPAPNVVPTNASYMQVVDKDIDPTLTLPGGPNDPPPTPPQTADKYLAMREAQLAGELESNDTNYNKLT